MDATATTAAAGSTLCSAVSSGKHQPTAFRLGNRITKFPRRRDPQANCFLGTCKRRFVCRPVRSAAWKFRHLRYESFILLTPINDHFVFVHDLPKFVFQDDGTHLFYLVRFRIIAITLQIDSLLHSGFSENVMATFRSFRKAGTLQQLTEVVKTDRCIGRTAEYLLERFLLTHIAILRLNTEYLL